MIGSVNTLKGLPFVANFLYGMLVIDEKKVIAHHNTVNSIGGTIITNQSE